MRNRLLGILLLVFALIGTESADASCWQWSKTASSNATADPSINWAEGMAPSAVNDSARAMMARLAECRDDLSGLLQTAGTSTAYTVTTNQGLNSPPQNGQQLTFRVHATNGASATMAADGGTAYPLVTNIGFPVPAGLMVVGNPYRVTFISASSVWILQDFYNVPIATNSITLDKLQQIAGNRLVGNATGSTANIAAIPLGAGMAFSGGALTATVDPTAIPGYISGLTLSTAGASTTFAVAAGGATDVALGGTIYLSSAINKTTASWAVGTGNGALDSGSIAINTWYHAFAIKRPDTGVVDACVSTSATGCAAGVGNIPAAYTLKRRIGSMKTNASNQWIQFYQNGDTFIWTTPKLDASGVAVTAPGGATVTLTVPTGVVVEAQFIANYLSASAGSACIVYSLQAGAQTTTTIASNYNLVISTANNPVVNTQRLLTNTSAQIKAINDGAASNSFTAITTGWNDSRGKN